MAMPAIKPVLVNGSPVIPARPSIALMFPVILDSKLLRFKPTPQPAIFFSLIQFN